MTNVGLDHQQFLGDSIREIANEKSGILKNGIPVVLGKMRAEAQSVILERAMKTSSEMHYGRIIPENLKEDSSHFFNQNAATAFETARVLKLQGWNIEREKVVDAINDYRLISGQRGRYEIINEGEDYGSLLLDCANNLDGIKGLINSLDKFKLHIVFGTVSDKDPSEILALIPQNSTMYFCSADIPRSMEVDKLLEYGQSLGMNCNGYDSVSDAVIEARKATHKCIGEQALVCGSVFVVGEAIQ